MDSESIDNDAQQGAPAQAHWPHRVDWRTGKITYSRDAEFWRAHERRRIEQGLTVAQYCKANDLASSTYRRRAKGPSGVGTGGRRDGRAYASASASSPSGVASGGHFLQLPTRDPSGICAEGCDVRVRTAQGLVTELSGAAAQQWLQRLARSLP